MVRSDNRNENSKTKRQRSNMKTKISWKREQKSLALLFLGLIALLPLAAKAEKAKTTVSSAKKAVASPTPHEVNPIKGLKLPSSGVSTHGPVTFNRKVINEGLATSIAPEAVAWAYCTDADGNKMSNCIAIYTYDESAATLYENIIRSTQCSTASLRNQNTFVDKRQRDEPLNLTTTASEPILLRVAEKTTKPTVDKAQASPGASPIPAGNGCFHNYLFVRRGSYKMSIWSITEPFSVSIEMVFETPSSGLPLYIQNLKTVMTGTAIVTGTGSTRWVSATFYDTNHVVYYNTNYVQEASSSESSDDCSEAADFVAEGTKAVGDAIATGVKCAIVVGGGLIGGAGSAVAGAAAGGAAGSEAGPGGTALGTVAGVGGGFFVGAVLAGILSEPAGEVGETAVKSAASILAAIAKPVIKHLCKGEKDLPSAEQLLIGSGGTTGSGSNCTSDQTCTTLDSWSCVDHDGSSTCTVTQATVCTTTTNCN